MCNFKFLWSQTYPKKQIHTIQPTKQICTQTNTPADNPNAIWKMYTWKTTDRADLCYRYFQ